MSLPKKTADNVELSVIASPQDGIVPGPNTVLFSMPKVRKPEYWAFLKLVAPAADLPIGKSQWLATDAEFFYCEKCMKMYPFKSGQSNSVRRHMQYFHVDDVEHYRATHPNLANADASSLKNMKTLVEIDVASHDPSNSYVNPMELLSDYHLPSFSGGNHRKRVNNDKGKFSSTAKKGKTNATFLPSSGSGIPQILDSSVNKVPSTVPFTKIGYELLLDKFVQWSSSQLLNFGEIVDSAYFKTLLQAMQNGSSSHVAKDIESISLLKSSAAPLIIAFKTEAIEIEIQSIIRRQPAHCPFVMSLESFQVQELNFVVVKLHYTNMKMKTFQKEDAVLGVVSIFDFKNPRIIEIAIGDLLKRYEGLSLDNNTFSSVVDNRAIFPNDTSNIPRIPCLLAALDELLAGIFVEPMVKEFLDLGLWFRKSEGAKLKLAELQSTVEKKTIQFSCANDSWLNKCHTLISLLELETEIKALLIFLGSPSGASLFENEIPLMLPKEASWQGLNHYVAVLKLFVAVSQVFMLKPFTEISILVPSIGVLKNQLEKMKNASSSLVQERLLNRLLTGLGEIYSALPEVAFWAVLLDPRFCNAEKLTEQEFQTAQMLLVQQAIRVQQHMAKCETKNEHANQSNDFMSFLFTDNNTSSNYAEISNMAQTEPDAMSLEEAAREEIGKFADEVAKPMTVSQRDPYIWWAHNHSQFPIVSQLARIAFSTVCNATSSLNLRKQAMMNAKLEALYLSCPDADIFKKQLIIHHYITSKQQ